MPQTKYDVPIADQAAADEIIKKTEDIKGVKFVNINPNGTIVVTHGDDVAEEAIKAAAGIQLLVLVSDQVLCLILLAVCFIAQIFDCTKADFGQLFYWLEFAVNCSFNRHTVVTFVS